MNLTRGEGILNRVFLQYAPHKGPMEGVRKGAFWLPQGLNSHSLRSPVPPALLPVVHICG